MIEDRSPRVGVIIPNYNGRGFLRECLASIEAQNYRQVTAIVVDNGSTDGSAEMVWSEFPSARLIALKENSGVAGENAGIELALHLGCEFIFLTDSDTVFLKDTIGGLTEILDQNPDLGIAVPFQKSIPSGLVSALGGTVDWMSFRIRLPSRTSSLSLVDYGGACMVRKSVFQRVGLIEARFIASWQDVDLGLRAKEAGFKVGVVSAYRLLHYGSSTLKAIPGLRGFVRIRNRLILARRHLAIWRLPIVALVASIDLPVQMGVWALSGERKEALTTAVGFFSGMSFLFRGREPRRLLSLGQRLVNNEVRIP